MTSAEKSELTAAKRRIAELEDEPAIHRRAGVHQTRGGSDWGERRQRPVRGRPAADVELLDRDRGWQVASRRRRLRCRTPPYDGGGSGRSVNARSQAWTPPGPELASLSDLSHFAALRCRGVLCP
jgi:hypothetical protein